MTKLDKLVIDPSSGISVVSINHTANAADPELEFDIVVEAIAIGGQTIKIYHEDDPDHPYEQTTMNRAVNARIISAVHTPQSPVAGEDVSITVTLDKPLTSSQIAPTVVLPPNVTLKQALVFTDTTTATVVVSAAAAGNYNVQFILSGVTTIHTVTFGAAPAVLQSLVLDKTTVYIGDDVTATATFNKAPDLSLLVFEKSANLTLKTAAVASGSTVDIIYTANAIGPASIAALYNNNEDGRKTETFNIAVPPVVASAAFDRNSAPVGDTVTLTVTFSEALEDLNGVEVECTVGLEQSTDLTLAGNGLSATADFEVIDIGSQTATVTSQEDSSFATASITTTAPALLSSIEIDDLTPAIGDTVTIEVTTNPASGAGLTGANFATILNLSVPTGWSEASPAVFASDVVTYTYLVAGTAGAQDISVDNSFDASTVEETVVISSIVSSLSLEKETFTTNGTGEYTLISIDNVTIDHVTQGSSTNVATFTGGAITAAPNNASQAVGEFTATAAGAGSLVLNVFPTASATVFETISVPFTAVVPVVSSVDDVDTLVLSGEQILFDINLVSASTNSVIDLIDVTDDDGLTVGTASLTLDPDGVTVHGYMVAGTTTGSGTLTIDINNGVEVYSVVYTIADPVMDSLTNTSGGTGTADGATPIVVTVALLRPLEDGESLVPTVDSADAEWAWDGAEPTSANGNTSGTINVTATAAGPVVLSVASNISDYDVEHLNMTFA